MYVTQDVSCTVQNSTTPITPAQLAAAAASVAAQDAQAGQLLQKWVTMIDRTPQSFADLNIVPSQFVQPQSAVELLNLDRNNNLATRMAAFRSGKVCNPSSPGPKIVPLNGFGGSLPLNETVDLMAKGPLGRPQANGMSGVGDLQPAVIAQRDIQNRMRRRLTPRRVSGMGCNCGGSCGPCKGLGDIIGTAPDMGSAVLWGSLAAGGFLIWAAFGNKSKGRR